MAQQQLSGAVRHSETGELLFPVVVANINTGKTVYSKEDGSFSISCSVGDLIAFHYSGFLPYKITVTTDLLAKHLSIALEPVSYQLKEFVVRPKNYTQYQIDSIERKEIFKTPLRREHASPMSPFSYVAERVSKNSKRIFQFQKMYHYLEDQKYIETVYSADLVYELTGLDGDTLAYFMNTYPMPYDYARVATELELKMWIRTNYKAWLKDGKPIPVTMDDIKKQ